MPQAETNDETWKEWTKGSSLLKGPLLALLRERPGYPYAFASRLYQRLGPHERFDQAAVYRLCKRFEQLGLASSYQGESDQTGQRVRIYEATALTSIAVTQWMQSPLPEMPVREPIAARIAVSQPEDAPYLLRALDQYQESCFKLLAEYRQKYPVETWRGMEMELTRRGLNLRVEAELEWINLARGYIASFPGERDVFVVV